MKPSNPNARPGMAKALLLLACCLAALSVSAQSASAAVARDEASAPDPFEKLNRITFYVNGAFDFLVVRPAAMTYRRLMPRPIRTVLRNAFSNMGEPTILFNDVLQGHGKKAARTLVRFAENSTIGLAGLFDVATRSGFKHHPNDFGITLARYGVTSGPYIFIPVIGPATLRDGIGAMVDVGLDPFTYFRFPSSDPVYIARTIVTGLDERAASDKDIQTIIAGSTDDYASIRSYFLQNREADITGGKVDINTLPDFGEPESPRPASTTPTAQTPPAPPAQATPPPAADTVAPQPDPTSQQQADPSPQPAPPSPS